MRSGRLRFWCLVLFAVLSAPAWAQLDHNRRPVNVRAGPDDLFPQVTRLPANTPLHVFGCTQGGRQWCDILAGRTRGWVRASDLSQSSRVRHAPVVTFSVEAYWDANYRARAWYSSRDNWIGWGTPQFRPPGQRSSSPPAPETPAAQPPPAQ